LVYLFAPIVCLGAGPIHAVTWEKFSLPFEESLYNLRVVWLYDPYSKSMYVGEHNKGLFKSRDGGKSWSRMDDGSFQPERDHPNFHSLQFGKDALFSLFGFRDGTRIVQIAESVDGKSWMPLWSLSESQRSEVWGKVNQLWIDRGNRNKMYAQAMRYAESPAEGSPEVARQLWSTDDSWKTFNKIATTNEWSVGSTDIHDGKICFVESGQQISCSVDNGGIWTRLSLRPITDSIDDDRKKYFEPIIHFNKTNGEVIIHWVGGLYETKNNLSRIEERIHLKGRLSDLVFHPFNTYPIYGILLDNGNEPWKVARIDASGTIDLFPGPKEKGFRLKAVDFSTSTLFMWGSSETFRGVLK